MNTFENFFSEIQDKLRWLDIVNTDNFIAFKNYLREIKHKLPENLSIDERALLLNISDTINDLQSINYSLIGRKISTINTLLEEKE